jgi:hypothetical protein
MERLPEGPKTAELPNWTDGQDCSQVFSGEATQMKISKLTGAVAVIGIGLWGITVHGQDRHSRIVNLDCVSGNPGFWCGAAGLHGQLTIKKFDGGTSASAGHGFGNVDGQPHPYANLSVYLPCRQERTGGVDTGPRQFYGLYITLDPPGIPTRILSFNTSCYSFIYQTPLNLPAAIEPTDWFTKDLFVTVVLESDDWLDSVVPVILQSAGQPATVAYSNDFRSNVGLSSLFGDAVLEGGSVRLTNNVDFQLGSLVIDDLVQGGAVASFAATFDLQTGPGTGVPADGISFNLGALPDAAFGEEGIFQGLTVSFDTTFNGPHDPIGIDVLVNGTVVARDATNPFTNGFFVPVTVVFNADGTLDLTFDGAAIFTNIPTGYVPAGGDRFGFGGRTGASNEVNRIDNVSIVAVPQ